METTLTTVNNEQIEHAQVDAGVFSLKGFEHAQRVALMLSKSSLIPKEYQGNVQNTMIALEMAHRIGASPLMVMQNLYIVHGKPSWSSTFIIAALNSCGRFSPLRFVIDGTGEDYGCTAWAYGKDGEKLSGPKVTRKMVKLEGWLDKNGSKWKTMEELMFRYRSAAFFGRLYAPDILMGMQTVEEVHDVGTPVVIQNEYTLEALKALYEEKRAILSDADIENISRVIDNNEVNSFSKAIEYLKTIQA